MRVVLFCHSLLSDWNHGNAHFLRGICCELARRGHDVLACEARDAWSAANLAATLGRLPVEALAAAYPELRVLRYDPTTLDLDALLDHADLVLVHEWNEPALVRAVGEHHGRGGPYVLLFHDTHHRSVTAREQMAAFDLSHYDGVLAFAEAVRQVYLAAGWSRRVWTWHEAADVRVFRPMPAVARERDLVWIGNWGDDERTAEMREFLLRPVHALGLSALVHGVRYPEQGLVELERHGLGFGGWLANFQAPEVFARHRVTVHVPRRPYASALPGVPTIRVFEALACGIPLVCAPWRDVEGLFRPGRDYLEARDGEEMTLQLRRIVNEPALAEALVASGRETILARHTCAHRVDELLGIVGTITGKAHPRERPRSAE